MLLFVSHIDRIDTPVGSIPVGKGSGIGESIRLFPRSRARSLDLGPELSRDGR